MATVEESVLRKKMVVLESQEEDAPKRILFLQAHELAGADQTSPS